MERVSDLAHGDTKQRQHDQSGGPSQLFIPQAKDLFARRIIEADHDAHCEDEEAHENERCDCCQMLLAKQQSGGPEARQMEREQRCNRPDDQHERRDDDAGQHLTGHYCHREGHDIAREHDAGCREDHQQPFRLIGGSESSLSDENRIPSHRDSEHEGDRNGSVD